MTASDPQSELPNDPLDECLKKARWPESTGLERTRLEARWDRLARERARSRRLIVRWALAASVLLAAGIGWMSWRLWQPAQPDLVAPAPKPIEQHLVQKPVPIAEHFLGNEIIGRAPNAYEVLAFQMKAHRPRKPLTIKLPIPSRTGLGFVVGSAVRTIPLGSQVEQLVRTADPTILQRFIARQRYLAETRILSQLPAKKLAEQKRDLEILKVVGSPRAIPVLDRLSRDPQFAQLAWPVALQLASPAQLGQWANSGHDGQRIASMQTLLKRTDKEAVHVFLKLVAMPASRNLALQVFERTPNPPIEKLFASLEQGTKEQRHTAGLLLGRIANPPITERLLILAQTQDFPTEIMIALLNSSDRQAARFFNQAKRNPQVLTSMQLARYEWEMISFTSTLPQPLEIH